MGPLLRYQDFISLVISVTAIAESSMNFFRTLLTLIADTTISGDRNLSIVKSCLLLDLITDEIKGVHEFVS